MKKLLLIAFTLTVFGCSKKETQQPAAPENWIIGKWKNIARFEHNETTQKTDTVVFSNEFTFTSDAVYSGGSTVGYLYKLGANSYINIYGGNCPLVKKSDTEFSLQSQLISPDGYTIYNITDIYQKE